MRIRGDLPTPARATSWLRRRDGFRIWRYTSAPEGRELARRDDAHACARRVGNLLRGAVQLIELVFEGRTTQP